MKVHELITELQKCDPDAEVLNGDVTRVPILTLGEGGLSFEDLPPSTSPSIETVSLKDGAVVLGCKRSMDNDDLIGRIGVIDDAHSPYVGHKVRVTAVNGNTLTVELVESTGLDFAYAEMDRKDVRML